MPTNLIGDLKSMLNIIGQILNESMVMELRIHEVAEKFRTLNQNGIIDEKNSELAQEAN